MGRRRHGGDPPAAGGGNVIAARRAFSRAPQDQRQSAGFFRRQLQAAAGGEADVLDLTHHAAKNRMAQSFFHGRQGVLVRPQAHDQQMFGGKAHARQPRPIKAVAAGAPQNGPPQTPGDAGDKARGGGEVGGRARARGFMQRAQGQTAVRPQGIHGRDAEG